MTGHILCVYGVIGSILAECIEIERFFRQGQRLPKCYRRPCFYVVRAIIALGAGLLPDVFAVESASAAFALGVGAPLVMNQLRTGLGRT
jgi:hypothetical protein